MAITVNYYRKSGRSEFTYDLHQPVGASGKNLPNDVRLVQTLLYIVYYGYPGHSLAPPAGESGLAVDGKLGNRTFAHIRQFKQQMRADGLATVADGLIHPVRGNARSRTRTGAQWVIVKLNDYAANVCAAAGQSGDYYLHLARRLEAFQVDESLRQELLANLRVELDNYPTGPVPL